MATQDLMSSGKRMVAVAIGVSDATPLPILSGALNGARTFYEWSRALGYEARLVTDQSEPVTAARLRSELEGLLVTDASGTHRLLIYFAGHGLIREVEEGLWLLSDWHKELRAVAVEPLKRRLSMYGVKQVAFFADACRSLPSDIDAADLTPDPLLGRGPRTRSASLAIDKFVAAQDGARTYAIPGATPAEDRCLFSGVLLEGLWGTKPNAFSTVVPGKVTSRSLGTFLQTEVPQVAASYLTTLVPSVSPTFPEGDDVYFEKGPQITPPIFPAWPPLDQLLIDDPHGLTGEVGRAGEGVSAVAPEMLKDKLRLQERPHSFETGSGFAVEGDAVVGIWTTDRVSARVHGQAGWWRIRPTNAGRLELPTPALIELASGLFVAATALPDFIGSLLTTNSGASALVYREAHSHPQSAEATEDAIGMLERGSVRADAATDLAIDLRQLKHVDPVRGVISAYLYDSIGDVDSIRRMAFYYVQHSQAIPYDIALLAQLDGDLRSDGVLWARVPAVSERKPRTERESKIEWTYSATQEGRGIVGGLWPWLRQGWAFLDDPAPDGSTLVLPGLMELADELTPARFTTFTNSGGRHLATLFKLQRRQSRRRLPVLATLPWSSPQVDVPPTQRSHRELPSRLPHGYGMAVVTAAAPERVWSLWSDVKTWGEWNPNVATLDLDGEFVSGSTGTITTTSGEHRSMRLLDVQPGRSFTYEISVMPGARFRITCRIEPSGNRTTLIQSVDVLGPLGPIMGTLLGSRVSKEFGPLLDRLKRKLETV
jgi:hypothetical protein